ncbi:hypothetical protein QEN19_002263 [Hanseniaspora menglaensis]
MLLNSTKAALIDKILMSPEYGYTLEQLMELAGLSCALSINQEYFSNQGNQKIFIIAGPGNNGGDGLVCARHLKIFGWEPIVYYPNAEKLTTKQPFFGSLVKTLEEMYGICVIKETLSAEKLQTHLDDHKFVVDSIFGFSFKPPMKQGVYQEIVEKLVENEGKFKLLSIDSPSGWDVDKGPTSNCHKLDPDFLISLTYPKLNSKFLKPNSVHYCGGRFISSKFAEKFEIIPLNYDKGSLIIKID